MAQREISSEIALFFCFFNLPNVNKGIKEAFYVPWVCLYRSADGMFAFVSNTFIGPKINSFRIVVKFNLEQMVIIMFIRNLFNVKHKY